MLVGQIAFYACRKCNQRTQGCHILLQIDINLSVLGGKDPS